MQNNCVNRAVIRKMLLQQHDVHNYLYYNNRTVWLSVRLSACDWSVRSAVPAHSAGQAFKPKTSVASFRLVIFINSVGPITRKKFKSVAIPMSIEF